MKHLYLFLLFIVPFFSQAQYYQESLITEEDGLLMDKVSRLYLDTASGMLVASHENGLSRIYGKDIKTVLIPEYESEELSYYCEIINDRLFFYHYEIKGESYDYQPFPFGQELIQITVTDADRDTLLDRQNAIRDKKGNFWLNFLDEEGEYRILKITGNDSTYLDLGFEHKVYYEAYFLDYYSVVERSQIFYEDKKGNMWILSKDNRIARIDIETNEVELSEMKVENIFSMAIDAEGRMIITSFETPNSPSMIHIFQNGQLLKSIELEELAEVYTGPNGSVYVLEERKQYQLNGLELDLLIESRYIADLLFDSLGNIYNWTYDEDYFSYLIKYSGTQKDTIFETSEEIYDIKVDAKGLIWIASQNGIIKLQPSSIKSIAYEFLDPINPNTYFFRTNLKSGWQFFNTTKLFAYQPSTGESKDYHYSLYDHFETKDGTMYGHLFDTKSEGEELNEEFVRIKQDASLELLSQEGLDEYDYLLNNDYYGTMHNDQLFLCSSMGVYLYNGNGFTKYPIPFEKNQEYKVDLIPGFAHFALFHQVKNFMDEDNKEVVSTILFNFESLQYETIYWENESVNIDRLYAGIAHNFLGKVKGKDQIISHFKGKNTLVDIPKSSLNDSIIKPLNSSLRWLHSPIVDKQGNYYFMAGVNGLVCFFPEEAKFKQITKKEGLVGNKLQYLFFNQDTTYLFMVTYEGIQSLAVEALQKGKLEQRDFYSRRQGVKGITKHQWVNDSTLTLHQEKGFLQIILKENRTQSLKLLIESIKVNSEAIEDSQYQAKLINDGIFSFPNNFELAYDENRVQFQFQAIDHYSESSPQYRYQLVGIDQEMIKSAYGKATYPNLPPGNYQFKVQAYNRQGKQSEEIAISFKVLKPYYQTAWFIILCLLAAGGLLYGLYRWRVRALKRKEQILKKLVKAKTKELEEEKNIALEQRDIIEEKNREITDSITYSKRLQDSILPPLEEIEAALPESFVCFLPKDIVSGDFYWFEEKEGIKFIACADCTGHGVPGAMVSLVCANALNRCVNEFKIFEPSKILDTARKLIIRTFQKSGSNVKDGMDISLCAIEGDKLTFAGAFNPLLVVRKSGLEVPDLEKARVLEEGEELQIIEVKADKQPVGLMDEMNSFEQQELKLFKGDTFYLFSDGIIDQFGGGTGKKLKAPNFRKLLLSMQSLDMKKQKEKIETDFVSWRGELEQIDDVCVIGVRI